jgi:tRNA dimethylallyltransferase
MIAQGLVEEVRGLLDAGYSPELPALSGVGYRQVIQHLRGAISLEDAIALIKRQTRRLVRQQGTWFRLDDPHIRWFDLETTGYPAIAALVGDWLRERRLAPGPLRADDQDGQDQDCAEGDAQQDRRAFD